VRCPYPEKISLRQSRRLGLSMTCVAQKDSQGLKKETAWSIVKLQIEFGTLGTQSFYPAVLIFWKY